MVIIDNKKETTHLLEVLAQIQQALEQSDSFALHQLSDQLLHTASIQQHTDILTIAVVTYGLHKLVTKKERIPQREWALFVKKFNGELHKSSEALQEQDAEEFARHLDHAKELIETSIGKKMAGYIQEILKKASVNKATKVYEHGISLSRTAHLLGLSQWDLLEYVGQRESRDSPYVATIDEKKRAAMALAFFS
ncbi:MAG: hypothetical protein AABX53_00575 [Nanoarchaeota archaeon]